MKIKTIDINGLEWFDKINGNSYFAGAITINYGMKNGKEIAMPFQYGYGDAYIQEAGNLLAKFIKIPQKELYSLWRYCNDNKIILRTNKIENCKKRELL